MKGDSGRFSKKHFARATTNDVTRRGIRNQIFRAIFGRVRALRSFI
jgi:hypothetical protein